MVHKGNLARLTRRVAGNPSAELVSSPKHSSMHWASDRATAVSLGPGCVILVYVCPLRSSLVLPEICGWHKILRVWKEHHLWPFLSSEDQKNYPEGSDVKERGWCRHLSSLLRAAITNSHEWLKATEFILLEGRV